MRERLPNRRRSERFTLDFLGIRYVVSFSRFDDGKLGELFIDAAKIGDQLNIVCRDLALVSSIALQHGAAAADIRASLERHSDGAAGGPLSAILDAIEEGC